MLNLRIDELLEEQGRSKYWLYKKLAPMSYQNFNRLYNRETVSIKFETLQRLKEALDCTYDELFITTQDKDII